MTKTARGITIDDTVWEKVKQQAIKEHRNVSNLIEFVLIKYLEEIDRTKKPGE